MYNFLNQINPTFLAFFGGLFSFFITILGSSLVFFFKDTNKNNMNILVSIAAGIMFAASFFSLLKPAIDNCSSLNQNFFINVILGLIVGGLFILLCNRLFDKININNYFGFKKSALLFFSITLHNIPEGIAIGVAFGNIMYGGIVEPIFAIIGAFLILKIQYLLSFILCFAAGAMIFVTVFDLIPESQSSEKKDLMGLLFIIGFAIMMMLDVLLG